MEEVREILIRRFEPMIDLPVYLVHRGFTLTAEQPGPSGLMMRTPDERARVLLERRSEREAWTYFPVERPDEPRTITDFLQREVGLGRAACLERLIALVGGRRSRNPDVVGYRLGIASKPEQLRRAQRSYETAATRLREANTLLERVGIRRRLLDEWRFGTLHTPDEVARLLAPPIDLWISRYQPADNRLVFTERPIDALSLEQGSRDRRTCYVALGRIPDHGLRGRIRALLARMPVEIAVVLAFGRDQEGRHLADAVQALAPSVWMQRLAPAYGSRWNDQAQLESRHARSMSPVRPRQARDENPGGEPARGACKSGSGGIP